MNRRYRLRIPESSSSDTPICVREIPRRREEPHLVKAAHFVVIAGQYTYSVAKFAIDAIKREELVRLAIAWFIGFYVGRMD